jgi:hypothetical protein
VRLPNADRAFIDLRKLTEYSLDLTHPIGGDKALVFRSILGFSADDAPLLQAMIMRAALNEEAGYGRLDEFGQRYFVDFEASASGGSARLRAAWIVRTGEDFPRLTTCFVLKRYL